MTEYFINAIGYSAVGFLSGYITAVCRGHVFKRRG